MGLLLRGLPPADSVVYGPESVDSICNAWRCSISPAISNQPAAFDGPEIDGPQSDAPENRGESRVPGSIALGSGDGAGAVATPSAGQVSAADAELTDVPQCAGPSPTNTPGIGRLPRSL